MENKAVLQHIQTVREALSQATPGKWEYGIMEGYLIFDSTLLSRHIAQIVPEGVESFEREEANATLIANSPTWLQQSIDLLEQQQREIERLKEALAQIKYEYEQGQDDIVDYVCTVNRITPYPPRRNRQMSLDKQQLLDWLGNRKAALAEVVEQHTGMHKRHLTGQHSALVDIEWEIKEGRFDVPEHPGAERVREYIQDLSVNGREYDKDRQQLYGAMKVALMLGIHVQEEDKHA